MKLLYLFSDDMEFEKIINLYFFVYVYHLRDIASVPYFKVQSLNPHFDTSILLEQHCVDNGFH